MGDLLKEDYKGKRCVISGAGNVAQYTAEKLIQLGGKPLTFSDRSGYVIEPNGFTQEQLTIMMDLKNKHRGKRVSEYCQHSGRSGSQTSEDYEGHLPELRVCRP